MSTTMSTTEQLWVQVSCVEPVQKSLGKIYSHERLCEEAEFGRTRQYQNDTALPENNLEGDLAYGGFHLNGHISQHC